MKGDPCLVAKNWEQGTNASRDATIKNQNEVSLRMNKTNTPGKLNMEPINTQLKSNIIFQTSIFWVQHLHFPVLRNAEKSVFA